ncbi:MAG: hypothetical protein HeimC2_28020 [Candidatus Heimdallarchaeota archaeon LC_2]|nr:MAG: hypothetical protein HeimC2_28020 [Candidatus Heimdallarchaeota archaeon LC_2]
MKLQKLIFGLLVVLLGASLLNTGSVVAQGPANTNFETGDYFYFNSTETRDDNWLNRIVLANDTNSDQLYRFEENYNMGHEITKGDLDLFLIKSGVNLPPFTSPEGDFDHLMIVDWEGMTVDLPGDRSTRSGGDKFFDAGGDGLWHNNTYPVEYTAGRYYSSDDDNNGDDNDGDDNVQPIVSNATYLILMSEMLDDTMYFDELDWFRSDMDLGTFNPEIPVTSRSVNDEAGTRVYVNGAELFLNTKHLQSSFATVHTETFKTQINFGGPNDPNAQWIDVNATVDITVNYDFEYRFDQANGMLLEIIENKNYSINLLYTNSSLANTPGGGPTTMSLEFAQSIDGSSSNHMTINEASSFYGNTRPVSSGVNRIEEGHLLVYDQDVENSFSFDTTMSGGNELTTGFDRTESRWGDTYAYGTASFDVYRHQPGSFDTVMVMEGIREGEWGYHSFGTDRGFNFDFSDSVTLPPEAYLDFDYMSFLSTASEEIQHFFDPNMNFNDDFLYDDDDNERDNGWRLNYDREVPMSGVVNHTVTHMDIPIGETLWINGYEHTWFELEVFEQKYETTYNQAVEIPVERNEDGEVWMTVQLTGTAKGQQTFYYDADTGVLLAMEQRIRVDLTLEGTEVVDITVEVPEQPPTTIQMSVDFYADITIEEGFNLFLSEHPVEYLTAEAADPVDHSIVDTTTTPPGTTTTPADTTSDDTTEESSDLPLPVPIIPVLSGLGIITILIRKRK